MGLWSKLKERLFYHDPHYAEAMRAEAEALRAQAALTEEQTRIIRLKNDIEAEAIERQREQKKRMVSVATYTEGARHAWKSGDSTYYNIKIHVILQENALGDRSFTFTASDAKDGVNITNICSNKAFKAFLNNQTAFKTFINPWLEGAIETKQLSNLLDLRFAGEPRDEFLARNAALEARFRAAKKRDAKDEEAA